MSQEFDNKEWEKDYLKAFTREEPQEPEKAPEGFQGLSINGLIFTLLGFFGLWMWYGFVFFKLWGWFLYGPGITGSISYLHAVGMTTISWLFTLSPVTPGYAEEISKFGGAPFIWIQRFGISSIILLFGFLISLGV